MEVVREECERQLLAIGQEEKRGEVVVYWCVLLVTQPSVPAAESEVERENKRLLSVIDGLRSVSLVYTSRLNRTFESISPENNYSTSAQTVIMVIPICAQLPSC